MSRAFLLVLRLLVREFLPSPFVSYQYVLLLYDNDRKAFC